MILNINSYYFTSSLYKELEDTLIDKDIKFKTYVPVTKNYYCREECKGNINKNVIVSMCINKYDKILFSLKHNKILKDIELKIDLKHINKIHSYSLFSNGYIAYKIHKKYNIPYIVMVQNTDINIFFKKMKHLRKLGIEILLNADKIIFFSDSYKHTLLDNYIGKEDKNNIEEKSIIIASGISNYWINNIYKRDNTIKNNIKLLYIGDINKNKNIVSVIKACKNMQKKGINIKYTIVGKVKDNKILKLIKKETFINYIEYMPRESLINIYRNNDIFIMPSLNESFGLVYLEAISQGMPVIYTRNQGFDKQFEDGIIGYSVNPKDIDEIVSSIELIYKNYNTISNNCSNSIKLFSWENIVSKYCNIYNQI